MSDPEYTWTLECPCCGDDAAFGSYGDFVADGQALACGCVGYISVDVENPPHVNADECECGR